MFTWGNLINCIAPYIAVCSETLMDRWTEYGSWILSPACRKTAFTKSEENLALEDSSVDIHELFNSNSSAVVSCAHQHSQEMIQFMPTSVFNHSVHPSEVVIAFKSICGEQIQSFMYCMDEMRLNATSPMDDFLFQIISTVNMRVAYHKLCSKLDVLKANINCLLNSALEMKQCMCFMNDLVEKVQTLSSKSTAFAFDQIVEPFCGSYVSFVECYVSLLSTCSVDLGFLMNDVYLGVLTSKCLNANMTSCSGLVPAMGGSEFLQCGNKVAHYLTNVSRNATVMENMEYMNMIGQMQDLVIGTYAYTCSIGTELLTCMKEKMLPSKNPFDRLLRRMFSVNKFRSILLEGCNLSLIKDVKSKMKFILSNMMSNPETSTCVDAMKKFSEVLKGQINLDDPNAADPYCSMWADFSECIESQLACSSPQLVHKWRTFTIDSMTPACYEIALEQQRTNQYRSTCIVDEVDDSAVSICGMDYLIPYQDRSASRNPILDQVDMVILEEIDHFCKRDARVGHDMVTCLKTNVPASYLILDRAVRHTFDFTVLEDVLKKACSLRPALKSHMTCIVDTIQRMDANNMCVHNLVQAFNLSKDSSKKFEDVLAKTCGAWNRFVHCVDPHIRACDHAVSHAWRELSFHLLSHSCKKQASSTRNYHSAGTEAVVSIATVLFGLLLTVFYT